MSNRTYQDNSQDALTLSENLLTRCDQWIMLRLAYTRPHTQEGNDVFEEAILSARVKAISVLSRDEQMSVVLELDTDLRFLHSKISHLTMSPEDMNRVVVHFQQEVSGVPSEPATNVRLIWS